MKILINDDHFKLITVADIHFLMIRIPHVTLKDSKGEIHPVDLKGLGNTTANAKIVPWLVTASSTRASFIFYENEPVSASYVYEKLHLYDRTLAAKVAMGLNEAFNTK